MSMTRIAAIDILVKANFRDFIEESEALELISQIASGEDPDAGLLGFIRSLEEKCTAAAEKQIREGKVVRLIPSS
jgi:hypothetical protein